MRAFKPGWKMTLFTALMLPLVVTLGLWQLSRGAEKRAMENDYLAQLTALPVRPDGHQDLARFQRVRLKGRFGDEIFLVDNQIFQSKPGYWIVQVFDDQSGRRYLTNRGYVPAPALRSELPELTTPAGEQQLVGTVWPFTGLIPVLDEDVWTEGWPKRVQRMDIARMAAEVSAEPFEVRLEPGQAGVAQAAPFATLLSDAKHQGYAATWFGLAVALAAAFTVFGFKH